jgi:large subunit ribosomal protein L23
MRERDILIRPLLSEKSYSEIANKKYVFVVAKDTNKTEIKLAVEKLFGVEVEYVNTVNCRGKLKRMGRNEGYTPSYKKAIVQLKADSKSIEFFDSMS